MAKPVAVTGGDLAPKTKPPQAATRQRGATPSAELVPIQFRMPPDFVRAFKQAALDRNMKLNELLTACFNEFSKK
jgi:hypothetical protein